MKHAVLSGSNNRPTKSRFVASVVAGAAILAGIATFMNNTGTIGSFVHKSCQQAGFCAKDPIPTPNLAGYDSPAMGGGHNQTEQCGPLLQKYQQEYPRFNVVVKSWEDSDKDFVGHVTYHCRYSATPK
jgi:hypothetical protein